MKSIDELKKYVTTKNLHFEVIPASDKEVGLLLAPQAGLVALYDELLNNYSETGWWPVRTAGVYGNLHEPWLSGNLKAQASIPTAAAVFKEHIDSKIAEIAGDGEFFGETGLPEWTDDLRSQLLENLKTTFTNTLATIEPELTSDEGLLVIPTPRPADVPAIVGWFGACNFDFDGADASAVLRSWEDRLGAVLYKLDFDTMQLKLGTVAVSGKALELLALEYYLFCPEFIDTGEVEFEQVKDYLITPVWAFWWD